MSTNIATLNAVVFMKRFIFILSLLTASAFAQVPADTLTGTTLASGVVIKYEVATIAALKALTVSALTNAGAVANVLGFYAINDGGGGLFWYDPSYSGVEYAGIITLPTSGSGGWRRVLNGSPINVRWTGAKLDNTTDDTTAIQLAIDVGTYGLAGVPAGTFAYLQGTAKTTNTLFIGYPHPTGSSYSYVTGGLTGPGFSRVTGWQSTINFADTSYTKPAIAIESGRGSTVSGIAINGIATRPVDAYGPGSNSLALLFWIQSNWENSNVSAQSANRRRYSPYAGVVQNAYSGSVGETSPAPYPIVAIPNYLQASLGASTVQYGRYVSAGAVLTNVGVAAFDVGILFNAFSNDAGDQNITDNLSVYGCTSGVSTTQPNQRRMRIRNSSLLFNWVAVTDDTHGAQNSAIDSIENTELDYNANWVYSKSRNLLISGARSEGGGCFGQANSITITNSSMQLLTWNNYAIPALIATGSIKLDGDIIIGSSTADVGNYTGTATFPVPFVFAGTSLNVNNSSIYPNSYNDFSKPTNPNAFFADMEAYSVTNADQENQIVNGMISTMYPGIVFIPYNSSLVPMNFTLGTGVYDAWRSTYFTGEIQQCGNNMGSATLNQRAPCLVGVNLAQSSATSLNTYLTNNYGGPSWNWSNFTPSEIDTTVTVGGVSCQYRQVYLTATWIQNSLLFQPRKGAIIYNVFNNTTPFLAVCVQNPTDTGVPNIYRFKVIAGYNGRAELSSGFALPGSGATYIGGGVFNTTNRIRNAKGPVIATFTSGSSTVTVDTSTGVDLTKYLLVNDAITASDPRVLSYSGTSQFGYGRFRVSSITNASTFVMTNNANVSATCELWIW